MNYADKTALITGATSGIGRGFAERFAQQGTHLVLVSRSADKLAATAKELRQKYNVQVEVVAQDLSSINAAQRLTAELERKKLTIDILVNNAGFGTHGSFEANDADKMQQELLLNVVTLTQLSRMLIPAMLARKQGLVINLASTAAFQPVPFMAVYGATKAFVLSFSEALWAEYRHKGIQVLALCPGATETHFFDNVAGGASRSSRRTVDQVLNTAFRAISKQQLYAVDGWRNYLLASAVRFAPRSVVAKVAARAIGSG